MSQDRSKIISKIRALMEKTTAQGCSEAEAMAAAAKVSQLMALHDVMVGELNFKQEQCETGNWHLDRAKKHPVHYCFASVLYYTGTKGYFNTSRNYGCNYTLYGFKLDVEIGKFLLSMIKNIMDLEVEKFKTTDTYKNSNHGTAAKDSFLKGMAITIADRLQQMADAKKADIKTSTGTDLVIVKDQIVEKNFNNLNLKLKTAKGNINLKDYNSFNQGCETGKKVNLNSGIGQTDTLKIK